MDHLREGIGLRGYGQRDPLVEYKAEAFKLFSRLQTSIRAEIVNTVFKVQITPQEQVPETEITEGAERAQAVAGTTEVESKVKTKVKNVTAKAQPELKPMRKKAKKKKKKRK
jgi:preprotein translocase subunit SecA